MANPGFLSFKFTLGERSVVLFLNEILSTLDSTSPFYENMSLGHQSGHDSFRILQFFSQCFHRCGQVQVNLKLSRVLQRYTRFVLCSRFHMKLITTLDVKSS